MAALRGNRALGDAHDGALRGLVGAGRTRLSLSAAMRARDVARPDADDLAEAERVVAARLEGRSGGGGLRGWPGPRGARRPAAEPRANPRQTAGGAGGVEGTGGSSPVRS
jgi:hypothetical protein